MILSLHVHGNVVRGTLIFAIAFVGVLVGQTHADDPPQLWVNVDQGFSQTQNVGAGFGLVENTGTELRIHLTSTNGTIKKSKLVEYNTWHWWQQVDGSQTDWRVTNIGPNDEFWCVIRCEMEYPPGGTGPAIRWMSVSDIDLDADTDNDSPEPHRPPSTSEDEDHHEYPGVVTGGVIGLVIPINDNNDVNWDGRDGGPPMDRDSDPDVLDCELVVNPKKGGEWYVLSSSESGSVQVVYTEDGTLQGEADRHLDKDESSTLNLRIESSYSGGVTGTNGELRATFNPEAPRDGSWAEDTVKYVLLGCDIDVDSDNDGVIESQNGWNSGEDFLEDHPHDDDGYDYHPELKYGMVVEVNDDDDDGDGNPDNGWDGTGWNGPNGGTVEGANDVADLKPGILHGLGLDYSEHTILDSMSAHLYIKKVGGDGAVRLFTDAGYSHIGTFDGNVEVSEFGGQSLFDQLYASDLNILIEGLRPGEVILSYELFVNNTRVHYDKVRIAVTGVRLTPCDPGWMPKGGTEDNEHTFTATTYPPTTIRFTLYDVSSESGYCVNRPAAVPQTGEDSDAWKDLQFKDAQSGFTISGSDKDVATTNDSTSSATVSVTCFDYGAFGKLKAEAQIQGTWVAAYIVTPNSRLQYATLPRDEDNNQMADCWVHNSGAPTDDNDASLNNTNNGDGLTRYQEYRGVDFDGDGKVGVSERLDPDRKDLFVQGSGFGGWVPFANGDAFNEAHIDLHEFVGTVSTDDRGIDVLAVAVLDQGGHLQKRGIRDWVFSTKGQSAVGTGSTYGSPEINKRANDYYFSDKPYKDGNTWTAVGVWGGAPNGVLDPLNKVEDTNDDGVVDANEKDGATTPPTDDGDADFDGDYVVKDAASWDWGQDLNPEDANNNGKVELGGHEYTKPQVVRHTVTHEMGHAVGIDPHCNDSTCLMYQYSNNWDRDGHFCNACRAQILIHNH